MEKLPPAEKIIEALTALADRRVHIDPATRTATITSSDDAKTYTVGWNEERSIYTSNDNATYWRGYAGYPVIAVLMLQGRLSYPEALAEQLRGIPWKELNTRYRNDYARALAEACATRGLDPAAIMVSVEPIMEQLRGLPIAIRRGKPLPRS